jgi:hypothetical protein
MKRIIIMFFCIAFALSSITNIYAAETGKVLGKVFQEKGFGYTIEYPAGWIYTTQSAHTVIFSGKKETEAYYSTVSIHNLLSTKHKEGQYKDIDAIIEEYQKQLKTAQDAKIYHPEPFVYKKDGVKLTGKQFMAEYTLQRERYKQWMIIILRNDGEVFHVWIYVSPVKRYETYLGIAKAMLDSWVILE